MLGRGGSGERCGEKYGGVGEGKGRCGGVKKCAESCGSGYRLSVGKGVGVRGSYGGCGGR